MKIVFFQDFKERCSSKLLDCWKGNCIKCFI